MSPLVLFFSHHLQVSGDELGLLGGGGSCCFALPQLVEGPTREQPNTPRATLFAGRLASSCRHWFWLLEFDMDVIWCYVGFVMFCSYFLLESPWYSPKSTWYTSTGECTAVETAWTWNMWNDHRQSLWRQGICWPKAAKITLNSSIHHCIGTHQTIHAQAICQPCSDFGRHLHVEVSNKMEQMDENRGAAGAVVDL